MQGELSTSPSLQFTIERDDSTLFIANRVLVELKTRKVGSLIEIEHDNLMELYESWYELFQNLREEIKQVPGHALRKRAGAAKLVTLATDVLNKGLRPHLTTYHSRFETWYKHEQLKLEYAGQAPQDIQKNYPDYDHLVAHLQQSSRLVQSFIEDLEAFLLEG